MEGLQTLVTIVHVLHAISAGVWGTVTLCHIPRVVRVLRGNVSAVQVMTIRDFFISLLLMGHSLRWWVWHNPIHSLDLEGMLYLAGLYILTIVLGFWALLVAVNTRHV
jgi:hypothetical protein